MDTAKRGIQSIEVGGQLLVALARHGGAMMLRDLARAAGMSPAKAHPYLVSFSRLGLVEQDAQSARYDLGPLALELGLTSLQRLDPVRIANAAITELAAATGHTVALAVWGNLGPTIIRLVESSRPVHVNLRAGTVMSPVTSATGRVFCAYLPPRATEDVIQDELRRLADSESGQAAPTLPQIAEDWAQVRRRGMARAAGRPVPGVNAFSAPVFDHTGAIALVITVLGPAGQFDTAWDSPIAAAAARCTREISARLGYREAPDP
jgi:DNA-binding IclR family transcriptional regulator